MANPAYRGADPTGRRAREAEAAARANRERTDRARRELMGSPEPATFLLDPVTRLTWSSNEEAAIRRAIAIKDGEGRTMQDDFEKRLGDQAARLGREAAARVRQGEKQDEDFKAYRSIAEKVRETLDNRARNEPLGSISYSVLAILAGITDAGIAAINEIERQDEISE
jgi:hypothetical protein